MIFDAHNHLQDERLKDVTGPVSVRSMVNGTSEGDWEEVATLAEKFPTTVIPCFGLHPWYIRKRSEEWTVNLETYLDRFPGSGLGEAGLDRWIRDHDLDEQEVVFEKQLQIAAERQLPLTIHCLRAFGRLKVILERNRIPKNGFLLHSYSGPIEMVDDFLELGGWFSISGYFMHERKSAARKVFREIPIDRLLVETDAPDMALPDEKNENPLPENVNHPANIETVYRFAAELRGMEESDFEAQIEENFLQFTASINA